MARPLEFKRRVRLPAELPLPEPRAKRHLDVRLWGAVVWLGAAAVAWSITGHGLPGGGWRGVAAGVANEVTALRDDTAPAQTNPRPMAETAVAGPATAAAVTATRAATDDATNPPPPLATMHPAPAAALAPTPHADDNDALPPSALKPSEPGLEATAEPAFAPPAALKKEPATFQHGMSCGDATAAYNQQVAIGGPQGPPDLSRGQFAAVLENGQWFAWCQVPSSFAVNVCVAVKDGHAVGVTVRTTPRSYQTEGCITKKAWQLHFPSSPRLDVTRTVFEAE